MNTLTQSLPKELESTTMIRFNDCDPYGHLNNARYIDYFMNARVDQVVAAYDFNIFDRLHTHNESWIVARTQIQYVWPARYNELVEIHTRLLNVSEKGLVLETWMASAKDKRLQALAWIEFVLVDVTTSRPKRHSPDLMDFFSAVRVDDDYNPQGFDERVQILKKQVRRVNRTGALTPRNTRAMLNTIIRWEYNAGLLV